MKTAIVFVLRVGVSLGITLAVALLVVVWPHDQALEQVKKQAQSVAAVATALERGQEIIKSLPNVSRLKAQTKDTRNYVQKLNSALPVFNVEVPSNLPELTPLWGDAKITKYNAAVRDPKLSSALTQSQTALLGGEAFFNHHYAVIKALANMLEYNPTIDTQSGQAEIISASLEAAAGGLNKTLQQINQASKYKDESLQAIIAKVKSVESVRKAYAVAINAGRVNGAEKSAYIAAVARAQAFIIADRQEFWAANREVLLTNLTQAMSELQPHSSVLSGL